MRAAVFFATREGQTRKIAERIADDLRAHEMEVDLHDVRTLRAPIDWAGYTTVCVAASVHAGHHEREIISSPAAIVTNCTVTRPFFCRSRSPKRAPRIRVRQPSVGRGRPPMLIAWLMCLSRKPVGNRYVRLRVAGELAYSKYNLLVRFFMKRIARAQRAPTDTSHDYEFTDWAAVDRFVADVARTATSAS